MRKIFVKDIMSFESSLQTKKENEFKIHFARYNEIDEPLDVFIRSQKEFQKWNEYKKKKKQCRKIKLIS